MVLGFLRDPLSSMCDREVTGKKTCQLGGVPGDQGPPPGPVGPEHVCPGGLLLSGCPPAQWLSEFHLYPSRGRFCLDAPSVSAMVTLGPGSPLSKQGPKCTDEVPGLERLNPPDTQHAEPEMEWVPGRLSVAPA